MKIETDKEYERLLETVILARALVEKVLNTLGTVEVTLQHGLMVAQEHKEAYPMVYAQAKAVIGEISRWGAGAPLEEAVGYGVEKVEEPEEDPEEDPEEESGGRQILGGKG